MSYDYVIFHNPVCTFQNYIYHQDLRQSSRLATYCKEWDYFISPKKMFIIASQCCCLTKIGLINLKTGIFFYGEL